MADDRSITGSTAPDDDVHDDDELAEVLAAELERYATGAVPIVRRAAPVVEPPMQPRAVPVAEAEAARRPEPPAPPAREDSAFARRAAEVERAMRQATRSSFHSAHSASADESADSFRRAERPSGRRSATGPILQPTALPTSEDLPVKRRTGFRPPASAVAVPPIEPLDRVLPTGPVTLPEATASLLDSMISDATGPVTVDQDQQHARHAAPLVRPPTGQLAAGGGHPAPAPAETAGLTAGEPVTDALVTDALVTGDLYVDWEQSLRSIGRPRAPWEHDDVLVPTGGDPNLPTVAIPVLDRRSPPSGPTPIATSAQSVQDLVAGRRSVHVQPVEPVDVADTDVAESARVVEVPAPPMRRSRSGRRRADAPEDAFTAPSPVEPAPAQPAPTSHDFVESAAFEIVDDRSSWQDPETGPETDDEGIDDEGIDEFAVDYPVVSAATTGAVDLPQVEGRPRTAPVFIERVRTALLQLPSVPSSPTGSGAAAIVGRWFGAFASPLVLVLAFGLAAAGSGPAAAVAVLAGALLAVPSIARTALWSARAADDAAMQEIAVLGEAAGRSVAVVLLLARIGAAATVLFFAGATAGAWADRTGAFGLGSSDAALLGSAAVAALGILCAALPARATAVLTLLAAVLGAIGTVLLALVLAPNGGSPIATTASGASAGAVVGFAGVGLLLVLCGADIARWRTDIADPVSTAVGSAAAVVAGGVLVAGSTVIASRLSGGGGAVDEFAGALSDASASVLAPPLLVILVVSAVTLPALLLRSSGAAAARLLGEGRPVRLGVVAAGLLALAGALGLLAAGVEPTAAALSAVAVCGVPVAAWAGLVLATSSSRRPIVSGVGLVVAAVLGWLLCDGLVPGTTSPVLAAIPLPASTGLLGGPALGLAVALVLGVVAGLLGGSAGKARDRPAGDRADTVEG